MPFVPWFSEFEDEKKMNKIIFLGEVLVSTASVHQHHTISISLICRRISASVESPMSFFSYSLHC